MFYAHFVLSKKGPLARIWLAAHWDKKLTRAHVFETNISSSVEAILEPKLKMALRTSGHLLLGVVRIYSRKAKYLLADCNEAFVKIKMAFRPGVVDLPDETNREAAIAAITLPENIHDFEATIADLNEINMNTIAINQSRPEDITMREDFGEINLGRQDDDFGDSAFDEVSSREIIRDGDKTFGDGIYRASDQLSVHHSGDFGQDMDATLIDVKNRLYDGNKQIKSIDSSGRPDNIGIDDDFDDHFLEPDDDDEHFGGGLVHSLFTDGIFEDPVAQKELEHLTSQIESEMATSRFDMQQGTTPIPTSIGDGMQIHDHLTGDKGLDAFVSSSSAVATDISSANIMTDTKLGIGMTTMGSESTTLLANESEAFALPPIDTTSATGIEHRRPNKRKRRLVVDDQKSIPSEIMKSQMENTSDITTQLDLAPPTKKLMYWKETGSVDKLFTLPARTITSKVLQRLFVRNLYTQAVHDDASEDSWYTAAMGPSQSYSGQLADQSSRSNLFEASTSHAYSPALSHTQKDVVGFVHEKLGAIAEISEEKQDRTTSGSRPFTSPSSSHGMMEDDLDGNHHDDLGFMMQPDTPYLPPPSILSEAPPSVMQVDMLALERELAAADKEIEHEMMYKSHAGQLPSNLASKEAMEGLAGLTTDESLEERRLEKRSKILLRVLYSHQQQHGWDDPLSLQSLCHSNTKKQAASKFYTILLLRKQGAVNLQQDAAYSDILLSRGSNFNRLIDA